MLIESDKNKEAFISGVNDIVNECISECCKGSELKLLSPYIENFMTLLTTNRDRSLVLWLLKKLFSHTSLENTCFYQERYLMLLIINSTYY